MSQCASCCGSQLMLQSILPSLSLAHTNTSSRLDTRRSSTITSVPIANNISYIHQNTHTLSLSLYLSLILYLALSPSLSIFLSLTLPLSLYLSLSHSLPLSLSLSQSQLCYKVRTTHTNIVLILNTLTDIPPVDLVCFPSEISRSRSLCSLSL